MIMNDALVLKFMETTIDKVNRALVNSYAVQQILIQKGIATENELINKIKEAEQLPNRIIGIETLQDMIKDFNSKRSSS